MVQLKKSTVPKSLSLTEIFITKPDLISVNSFLKGCEMKHYSIRTRNIDFQYVYKSGMKSESD